MRPSEFRVWVRRNAARLAWLATTVAAPAVASPLFEDDAVLDIRLSGPLDTLIDEKRQAELREHPFLLQAGDAEIPVDIRVRGKSRVIKCPFPPLRLDFDRDGTDGTVFAGQDKLKLVTHCRSNSDNYENNTLEEYTAYRIFNLLTDAGYRVRLLRIRYDDTDGKQRGLQRPYFGFVIESDAELASRMGGEIAELTGVLYSSLDPAQTSLLSVFQYLIGNMDWSFVRADDAEYCCHNVDLVDVDGTLYPIPYDFDFSGSVNADYAAVPRGVDARRVTQRVYRGYCRSQIDDVAAALDLVRSRRDAIIGIVENSPVQDGDDTEARVRYIEKFFDLAEDADKLLTTFDGDCVGPR